jgi:hypothetical protein
MKLRQLREGDVLDDDGITLDDLDQGIAALARCRHQVVPNPYHDA